MADKPPNPYSNLPEKAFWKSAVASHNPFELRGLWNPKFRILPKDRVATFGSCFAQHIGRALRAHGYNWFIAENAPPGLSDENLAVFNYDLFSARTGNIYTASLLRQWVQWALGEKPVPEEYWVSEGRYYDPFRPAIEPNGFASLEELRVSQATALAAFKRAITQTRYFVFTLGLTESWFNKTEKYEYPMCPGTVAGTFDPNEHVFRNQQFDFVNKELSAALTKMRSVNKRLRVILTVSPVPLTATRSKHHVMVATMGSKSVLRAVAGQLANHNPWIDYFPSYEIISSPVFGGRFFEPNMRSVGKFGVDFVMNGFFGDLEGKFGVPVPPEPPPAPAKPHWLRSLAFFQSKEKKKKLVPGAPPVGNKPKNARDSDVVCEEQLLEAFGKQP